jgi:hypothetical protein
MVHLPKNGAEPFRQAVQEMADDLRTSVRGDLHKPMATAGRGAGTTEVVAEEQKAENPEDAFLREIGLI